MNTTTEYTGSRRTEAFGIAADVVDLACEVMRMEVSGQNGPSEELVAAADKILLHVLQNAFEDNEADPEPEPQDDQYR